MPRLRMRSLVLTGLTALAGAVLPLPALAQMTSDFQPTPYAGSTTQPKFQPQTKPVSSGPTRFGDLKPQETARYSLDESSTSGSDTSTTGFDSSNARKKKKKGKAKYTPPPILDPAQAAAARAIARGPQQLYARELVPSSDPVTTGSVPVLVPVHRRPPADVDPYAPVGIRAGSFSLFPAIELTGAYDSNPLRRPTGPDANLFVVAPELRVKSEWQRHQLTAELRGSYTTYSRDFGTAANNPADCGCVGVAASTVALTNSGIPVSLDRPDFNARVNGRLDTYQGSHADAEARFIVGTDNPGSPNITADLKRIPIYTQVGTTLGYTQNYNRLDLTLKGGIDRVAYQASSLTDGTTTSNDDRDFNAYALAFRAGYQLRPGVEPFAEVSLDQRVHDMTFDRNGLQRDSDGITGRAGSTFELTRQLVGEISAGYTTRQYKDTTLPTVAGFIFDSTLVWTQSALTTYTLTAKSATDESILADVSGALRRDITFGVDQSFRRWLIGSFKAGAGFDHYIANGPSREDQRFFLSAALVYKLSREWQVKSEIRHEWLNSTAAGVNYSADIFLIGVRRQRIGRSAVRHQRCHRTPIRKISAE